MLRAVTANLGCASPSRVRSRRVEAAATWSRQVRDEVDLAFLQEVPSTGLVDGWLAAGCPSTRRGER